MTVRIRTAGGFLPVALPLLVISLSLAFYATGCKKQEVATRWADQPIEVDGNMTEWSELPSTFFEEEGASISLCSDNDNLYIHMRCRSAQLASSIRMTGVTLWIDADGGTDKDVGIKYNGGPSLEDVMASRAGLGGNQVDPDMQERMMKKMAGQDNQLVFIDKKELIEAQIAPEGANGPAAAYDTSMGFYCYEFSVPLGSGGIRNYGLNVEPGQKIGLGAVWGGGFDRSAMQDKMGGRGGGGMGGGRGDGGGGRGGGGGGRGGGGKGGPGGDMGGSRPEPPSEKEVWIKTTLATPVVPDGGGQ